MDKVKYYNPTIMKAPHMSKLSTTEVVSYAGASTSIGGALTLTEVGVIIGIVTALLTFIFNAVYTYRKNQREVLESEIRIEQLKKMKFIMVEADE